MGTKAELERLLEQANRRCDSLVEAIKKQRRENLQLFNKWNAINEEKIQLKKKLEQADKSYDILVKENEALLLRADRFEAERNELKKRMEKMKYDFDFINSDRNLLKAENDKLKEENVDLRFESVKAFERGTKFPCNLDCDNCTEKCRAWQRGFDATCERESGNCDVLKGMKVIAEVVSNTL